MSNDLMNDYYSKSVFVRWECYRVSQVR